MYKLICMNCYEIYDMPLVGGKRDICPKAKCAGDLIEIDDLMISPIIELNKKGYYTDFCCSGHSYETSPAPYVRFNWALSNDINPPEGWEFDDGDRHTIRAEDISDDCTDLDKYQYVLDKNASFTKWAYELKALE